MNDLVKILKDTKKHLMTGVSYMIPFVVTGGVILAVSVLLSGETAVPDAGALGKIAQIGVAGLGLMVPILSGFIAFSISDRLCFGAGNYWRVSCEQYRCWFYWRINLGAACRDCCFLFEENQGTIRSQIRHANIYHSVNW